MSLDLTKRNTPFELVWLSDWFASHCDGEWEHAHGLSLQTLDNPGWLLEADVDGADSAAPTKVLLERGVVPSPQNGNIGGDQWIRCEVVAGRFRGAGDAHRLGEILSEFRRFILVLWPDLEPEEPG